MSFETIFATEGVAIFTVGLLVATLTAVLLDRNPAAGGLWTASVLALLVAGVFGLDQAFFWVGMMLTTLTIVAGFVMGGLR